MKRYWGHIGSAAAAVGLAAVLLPACAHDDSTIYIVNIPAPPTGIQAGQACAYTPQPNGPFLPTGLWDVALSDAYSPAVLVGNQMIQRMDPLRPTTETNRVEIQGATVRVTDAAGTQIASFSSLTSGTVDPASGTQPGYMVTLATIVDPQTAAAFRTAGSPLYLKDVYASKTIVAYFKLYGSTLGGTSVESNEFQFPIKVCKGCLVTFNYNTAGQIDCLTLPTAGAATPCVPGQDQVTSCYYCYGHCLGACSAGPKPAPDCYCPCNPP
jgi:hypothetical protein